MDALPKDVLAAILAAGGAPAPVCRAWRPAFDIIQAAAPKQAEWLAALRAGRARSVDSTITIVARAGRHELLDALLCGPLELTQALGRQLLYSAALTGETGTAAVLLRHGTHAADSGALNAGCWSGHVEVVKLLLDTGVNVNADNGAALRIACDNDNVPIARELIRSGAAWHEMASHHAPTLAITATPCRVSSTCRATLGVVLPHVLCDAVSNAIMGPLALAHIRLAVAVAVINANYAGLDSILRTARSACLLLSDEHGCAPLAALLKANLAETAVAEMCNWCTPSAFAAFAASHPDFVRVTPHALRSTASRGATDILRALMDAMDCSLATPQLAAELIECAAQFGHTSTMRLVFERWEGGAAVAADFMCIVARGGHTDAILMLARLGCPADAVDGKPAALAARNGLARTVAMLLILARHTAAQKARALCAAARHGHLDCVRVLLACGADACAVPPEDLTHAAARGHLDVLCALMSSIKRSMKARSTKSPNFACVM